MRGFAIRYCLALLLSGCATSGMFGKVDDMRPPVRIETTCQMFKLILMSKNDQLTDGTRDQIIAHNVVWEGLCQNKFRLRQKQIDGNVRNDSVQP